MNNENIKETRDKIIKDYKVPGYHASPELELKPEIKWLMSFLVFKLKWNIIAIKIKTKYYLKNLLNRFSIFKEEK